MGPAYDPAPGIAKFMTGTPTILGTAAVEESVRLLLEAGIGPMRTKSIGLTSYLIELADAWLAPVGCELATPRDPGAAVATSRSGTRSRADRRPARGREHHHRLPHTRAVPARRLAALRAVH